MERGGIECASLSGGFDLRATLESGQSYCWRRLDDDMYGGSGDAPWYETTHDGRYVRVRQRNGTLEWRSDGDGAAVLFERLRLDDDLASMYRAMPDDALLNAAIERFSGMRLVRDPVFPCLISFICSAQMRVERIHRMQRALADTYGDPVDLEDMSMHAYPTPERLAQATEAELRSLGIGYRAPYVRETAAMVAAGEDPERARSLPYPEARSFLTRYVGVGEKVADCVLLFSLDKLEAVPLDTWIRSAIADHYPSCDRGSYAETSRAIRERLGGEYAGYAQTYLFHHLRLGEAA